MKNQQLIWARVSKSYQEFALAWQEFFAKDVDRISLMKSALMNKDRGTAIYLLQYIPQSELIYLFNELVFQASFGHGAIQTVRQAILRLPRDWVIENIEQVAEPLLEDGTYDEYRRFLELYLQLDRNLTVRLAERAAKHEDPDIREAGEDYLNKLDLLIPPN